MFLATNEILKIIGDLKMDIIIYENERFEVKSRLS